MLERENMAERWSLLSSMFGSRSGGSRLGDPSATEQLDRTAGDDAEEGTSPRLRDHESVMERLDSPEGDGAEEGMGQDSMREAGSRASSAASSPTSILRTATNP